LASGHASTSTIRELIGLEVIGIPSLQARPLDDGTVFACEALSTTIDGTVSVVIGTS
jgi:hypothetical protein